MLGASPFRGRTCSKLPPPSSRVAAPPLNSCQRGIDRVHVPRIELDQARLASGFLAGDQGGPRAAERVEHGVPALARVLDRPFYQRDRLHGRMDTVARRLVHEPHVALAGDRAPNPTAVLADHASKKQSPEVHTAFYCACRPSTMAGTDGIELLT